MSQRPPTFGSLFAGSGSMDRACELAGFTCAWQVENNKSCITILERHFPGTERHGDIRELDASALARVDLVIGGDPCPHRSKANRIHGSNAPDLWPDFLRVVSALRPVWVLREHVVAGDADECWCDLCSLGYSSLILEADSAEITGQSRPREYLCGVLESAGVCPGEVFSQRAGAPRNPPSAREASPVAQCLTTHNKRFDSRDNYVLEPGAGMRILCAEERERLQGFEPGWTGGLSEAARTRMTGNAATLPLVRWMAERIAGTFQRGAAGP